LGGKGIISVIANILPARWKNFARLILKAMGESPASALSDVSFD